MWNFQEVFLIILSLFVNLKLMSVLFIHETFLGYKLETFTNCNEVKHIMIMIVTIIYIFLSSEIFGQQLKITFRKSSVPSPPEKIPPIFTHSELKIQKVPIKNSKSTSPPPLFCQHWKFFRPLLHIVGRGGHYAFFSKNGLILPNFGLKK